MGGRSIPSKMMETTNEERKERKDRKRYLDWENNKFPNDQYISEYQYFDKDYKEWKSKMTDDEFSAVRRYTGSAYRSLNDYLRKGKMLSGQVEEYEQIIKNATKGLDKFVLKDNMVVYRRSSADLLSKLGIENHFTAQNIVNAVNGFKGSVVQDKGFTSTSTRKDTWSGKVLYEIRVPSGTRGAYVDHMSINQGEHELLLNRGTHFQIVSASLKNGTPVVVMKVVRRRVGKKS